MNELMHKFLFLPPQASSMAKDIDYLHYFVITITLIMSTLIGLLAIYFMTRYRRRRANQATPHIEAPFWAEVLFVTVPLGFFLLWFRIGFAQFVDLSTPPPESMDVYVMAKKWMWKFAYPDGPNGLSVVRVPVNRPVRLLLTSRDVIHSFYVPAFRIKQDVLPGRYTQTWFKANKPGVYPVFCTEYCGTGHSTMRAQVVVMEEAEYDQWLADEQRGRVAQRDTRPLDPEDQSRAGDLVEQGRRIAAKQGCLKCHSIDGSPHIGPSWLDLYHRKEALAGGKTIVVDEAYLTESMNNPRAEVVAGFPLVMPSFHGRLSAPETAAIIEFIKSLRTTTDEPTGESERE
jgi:cytochrome c oxidase subunit II